MNVGACLLALLCFSGCLPGKRSLANGAECSVGFQCESDICSAGICVAAETDASVDVLLDAGDAGCSGCVIEGQCYADGEVNSMNPCQVCDVNEMPSAWMPGVLDGEACVVTLVEQTSAGREEKLGPLAGARIPAPAQAIATEAGGDIYIATVNKIYRIRDGAIDRIAGDSSGALDGPVATARFMFIGGLVTLMNNGTHQIYVSDRHALRRIENDTVSTVAGVVDQQGPASDSEVMANAATFTNVRGLLHFQSVNGSSILLADSGNHQLRQFVPQTTADCTGPAPCVRKTVGSTMGDSVSPTIMFRSLTSLADLGNVRWVINDQGNNRLKLYDNGTFLQLTAAGGSTQSADGGVATDFVLDDPAGVAGWNSTAYVSDRGNNRIVRIAAIGSTMPMAHTIAGAFQQGNATDGKALTEARFAAPGALALSFSEKYLYVADTGGVRVLYVGPLP